MSSLAIHGTGRIEYDVEINVAHESQNEFWQSIYKVYAYIIKKFNYIVYRCMSYLFTSNAQYIYILCVIYYIQSINCTIYSRSVVYVDNIGYT